ncbi:MAG: helix-turn-helix transcriptional regulator [Clostridia bacterium]|nr:helix-turn-helix transcriptional regulator [Clostridia bacterium]
MSNFYEMVFDALEENHKTFKDLEDAGVIKERVYYQFKDFTPFLPQVLKIANFLEMSLDYITNRDSKNKFKKYKTKPNFYINLKRLLNNSQIKQCNLEKELNLGRSNFTYWKNGSLPKLNTIIQIADYLKCSIDDLLDYE